MIIQIPHHPFVEDTVPMNNVLLIDNSGPSKIELHGLGALGHDHEAVSPISKPSDLPSIHSKASPISKSRRPKKPRKIMRIGVKRNSRTGKLAKATRDLAEISSSSLNASNCEPNQSCNRNESSLFSAGTILCDGSISSNDISCCNNKFWALQGKSVAMKVWEAAKKLGVEGNLPDERYVEMVEAGERRDKDAHSRRVNNNDGQ